MGNKFNQSQQVPDRKILLRFALDPRDLQQHSGGCSGTALLCGVSSNASFSRP